MIYKIRTEPQKRETSLRLAIRKRGYTQKQVCELTGVTEKVMSELCSGIVNDCHLSTAKKICNVLDIDLHMVFYD